MTEPLMPLFSKARRTLWRASIVTLLVASCSFQDFEYLQDSTSTTSSASSGPGNDAGGANSNGSNASGGNGGSSASGGSSAGTSSVGGAGGSAQIPSSSTTGGATHSGGSSSTSSTEATSSLGGSVSNGGSAGADTTDGLAGAAGSPGSGGGNILANPSFEEFWTGWSVDPPEARGKYANVKWPQPGSFTPNGESEENLLGTWHMTDAFVVSVYQVLEGIEDGRYTFKGFFNWGGTHNSIQIFARNCGGEDLAEDVPATAPTQWTEVGIGGIEVVGGHCEVGFMLDSNPEDWLNADMFSFEMDPQ